MTEDITIEEIEAKRPKGPRYQSEYENARAKGQALLLVIGSNPLGAYVHDYSLDPTLGLALTVYPTLAAAEAELRRRLAHHKKAGLVVFVQRTITVKA
jgi:hypothetical protein